MGCGKILDYFPDWKIKSLVLEKAKFKCLNGNCEHEDFYEKAIQHLPICKCLE